MGKVHVDRERFIIFVIVGRIVAKTCFRRTEGGIRVKVTLFIRRGMQMFSHFVTRCRKNDDKTLGVRGGLE